MSVKEDLIYYLGYAPQRSVIREAKEWLDDNPGRDIAEWVSAMLDQGLL